MKKEIKISRKIEIILKVLLVLSIPFFTLILSRNYNNSIVVLSLNLSLIIGIIISYKLKIEKVNVFKCVICFLLSDYFIKCIYDFHFNEIIRSSYFSISKPLLMFSSIMAIIFFTILLYILMIKFEKPIKKFFRSFSLNEKCFLTIFSIIFFFIVLILYNLTNVFYSAGIANYDVIYTTDSSYLFKTDAFLNPNSGENSAAKQPLFGVFALPFAVLASILSKIFFFIPNSYPIFLTFIQIVLFGIMAIMIARMFEFKEKDKPLFYLFYVCCFSTIIFLFTLEQYIISTFYLILMMYIYFTIKKGPNYSFVPAAGTLTTSAIMLPFLSKSKSIKEWIFNAFKCFITFMMIAIIFGQFYFIFDFIGDVFDNLNDFSGKDVSFTNKLQQYFNFVKGIFISIPGYIVSPENNDYWYYQYLLKPVHHFSKIGILILLLCLVSVILNRKNKVAKISLGWILFSILLIVFVGFGTIENGVNLYSLYFSWTFIGLIYLLIDKVVKNKYVKTITIVCLCVIMLVINMFEFINIINFGFEYYKI